MRGMVGLSRVCVRVCRVCHVKEGLSSGPAVCGCARGTHRKLYLKVKLVYLCAWHPPAVCFCYLLACRAVPPLRLRGRGRACRVWTSRYGFRLLSSVSACKFSVYKYMDMRVYTHLTPHMSQETAHAELSDASSATCACFPVAIMTSANSVGRTHVQPLIEAAIPLRWEAARLLVALRRLLRARRARLLSRRGAESLPPDVPRLATVEVDGVHPRTECLALAPHEDLGGGRARWVEY